MAQRIDRRLVVELLSSYSKRPADLAVESLDSLETAWLIHQVEQRLGVELDLDDDQVLRMSTVDSAVVVLNEALHTTAGAAAAAPLGSGAGDTNQ